MYQEIWVAYNFKKYRSYMKCVKNDPKTCLIMVKILKMYKKSTLAQPVFYSSRNEKARDEKAENATSYIKVEEK